MLAVLAGGPKSSNAIRKDALGAGISWRTIERAKKRLGIKAIQSSDGWAWSLDGHIDHDSGKARDDAS